MEEKYAQYCKALLVVVYCKKVYKKYKLKVKISNQFNSLRITTATNCLYFITLTHGCNYGKKVKKIRRSNVSAQIILLIPNIDYKRIFNEHLELLGVIDIKKSLAGFTNDISGYLDYFFNIEKVH